MIYDAIDQVNTIKWHILDTHAISVTVSEGRYIEQLGIMIWNIAISISKNMNINPALGAAINPL